MIVKIPRLFAEDHDNSRELPSGKRLDVNSHYVTYDADQEELEEWLNDAQFYADVDYWRAATDGNHHYLLPTIKSAQRAVPRIKKVLNA